MSKTKSRTQQSVPERREALKSVLRMQVREVERRLDELDSFLMEAEEAYTEVMWEAEDSDDLLAEVVVHGEYSPVHGLSFDAWLSEKRDEVLSMLRDLGTVKYPSISSK